MADCARCGAEMRDDERFCRSCGAVVEQASDEDTLIMRLLSEAETEPRAGDRTGRLWLLDSTGHQVERAAELTKDITIIGRRPDCDIALTGVTVSRRHAQIQRDGDRCLLSDLGSTNGTLLNGEPVIGEEVLRDRDEIAVGTYKLIFRQG